MPKINKRLIESAEARDKAYDINDSELRGFGVYVLPSGTRSFFVRYRLSGRRDSCSQPVLPRTYLEDLVRKPHFTTRPLRRRRKPSRR